MPRLKTPITFETTFSQYVATEQHAQGGCGSVYRGTDPDGQEVAIKLLDPLKASSRERHARFKNELTFGMRNEHPNVVRVLDHGLFRHPKGATPFYVMPFYSDSLRSLMARGIEHAAVMPLFSRCLDGVEAAHLQNIIHRDLKPENILCDSASTPVIADFGIADFSQDELYTLVETKPHGRLANFQYAAPEQKIRSGRCDARTDIFALGQILNEMFTGTVPYGTGYQTIAAVATQFAYLDDLVSLMIRQNPSERPASIEAIKRELIARGNLFIERQKHSQFKQTVVATTKVDDPIESNPVRLASVDWNDGILVLVLNQTPPPAWIEALQNGNVARMSILGKGPAAFQFSGSTATIGGVKPDVAQQIVDHFKSWLPAADQLYLTRLKAVRERAEESLRQQLAQKIRTSEERQRVLSSLRV